MDINVNILDDNKIPETNTQPSDCTYQSVEKVCILNESCSTNSDVDVQNLDVSEENEKIENMQVDANNLKFVNNEALQGEVFADHKNVEVSLATNISVESDLMDFSNKMNDKDIEQLDSDILVLDYYSTNVVKGGYIEKLRKLEKVYKKSRRMNQILKNRLHNQRKNFRKKIQELENQVRIYKEHSKYLNNFLNEDQLKLLSKTYKKYEDIQFFYQNGNYI